MNDETQVVGLSEYAGHTTVHPMGLLAVAVLGLAVLWLPRRWSIVPFLVIACFVPSAQRIVLAGLDFNFLRIMVLFGCMRLLLSHEYRGFIWNPLDTAMVLWTISSIVIYTLQQGTVASLVFRLGFGFDAFGMYFVFRCLVRDWRDLDSIVFGIIVISIPVALFFLIENRTGRNLFSLFGGVSEFTEIREGRLRCQGAYSHPILAGCFWASLMPLIAAYGWKSASAKTWVIVGLIASSIIVVCSASSTPVMAVAFAVIGGLTYCFRRYLRMIRWGILLLLISLHFVMNNPVWHLISRVSAVGGSTSWHRYNVINQAINHFSDWWLMGCSGLTVVNWGIFRGDVTNQYVLEGIRGGFLTLVFFITVIVIAFRGVGSLWRLQIRNPYRTALSWALGVSLFVHCMNFIGVAYFGQIFVLWYLVLAIIGSLTSAPRMQSVVASPARAPSLFVIKQET